MSGCAWGVLPNDLLGWQKRQLWSYRWWPGDCVVFQVSIDAGATVVESGMGTDLACGGPNVKD